MKKFFAIAIIAASLTACGGGETDNKPAGEDTTKKETPAAPLTREDSVKQGLITETPAAPLTREDSVKQGLISAGKEAVKEAGKEAVKEVKEAAGKSGN